MTALLDVDKLVRFSRSSPGADKLYKTIGYGLDAAAYLFAPTAQPETAQNIHALASNISMARYVLRFTGGLEAYTALTKGLWSCEDDDEHVQRLVRLQALSMVVYHPLEHVSIRALKAKKKQLLARKDLTDDERSTLLTCIRDRCRELKYVQLRNLLNAGPCIQWSFERKILSDRLVSFLCAAEAAIGLWRAWTMAE